LDRLAVTAPEPDASILDVATVPGVVPALGVEDLLPLLLVHLRHEPEAPDAELALFAVLELLAGLGIDDLVVEPVAVGVGPERLGHPQIGRIAPGGQDGRFGRRR